eukprot:270583_1
MAISKQLFSLLTIVGAIWLYTKSQAHVRDVFMIRRDTNINFSLLSLETKHPQIGNKLVSWDMIIKERDKMPSKCDNSKDKNIMEISPVFNNWAPFWYRCNISWRKHESYFNYQYHMYLTKEINYNHVFKAAGSTINHGLDRLISKHIINITKYNTSRPSNIYMNRDITRNEYRNFMNDQTFVFTFIRDPISKFLSGFYEVNRRLRSPKALRLSKYDLRSMQGIDILRLWIDAMLRKLQKPATKMKDDYLNIHTAPNVIFLSGPSKDLYNFVGVVSNLNKDLPQILQSFIMDQRIRYNSSLLMTEYFIHTNGHDDSTDSDVWMHRYGVNISEVNTTKFDIKISELNDGDIDHLCQIYWIEYICFPWDVPAACNLTDLFVQHYGKHVEYRPCYS